MLDPSRRAKPGVLPFDRFHSRRPNRAGGVRTGEAPQIICSNELGNPTGLVFSTAPGSPYLVCVSGNDAMSAGVFELAVSSVPQFVQCVSETNGELGVDMFDTITYLRRRDLPSTAAELVIPSNAVNDDDTLAYTQGAVADEADPDCPPSLDAPELRLAAEIVSGPR